MSDIRTLHPSFEADNVLQLNKSESYDGRVFRYVISHSVLILKLESDIQRIFIGFEPTYYIDLPAWWKGGNIKTASLRDTIHLYHKLGYLAGATEHDLPKFENFKGIGLRLFLIETPINQFRILAEGHIWISNDSPQI